MGSSVLKQFKKIYYCKWLDLSCGMKENIKILENIGDKSCDWLLFFAKRLRSMFNKYQTKFIELEANILSLRLGEFVPGP